MAIRPIDELVKDNRVHISAYTDPEVFEEELRRIFYTTWLYIGHESEVAQPGDYKTALMGLVPVILSRTKDSGLLLLINRCMHRGATVCQRTKGNANYFKCEYHGWVYGNDGALTGVTQASGYGPGEIVEAELGLRRVPRVASYRGFVFGSLAPAGPTLEEHLGLAKGYLDLFADKSPDGAPVVTGGYYQHSWESNWKLQLEGAVEEGSPEECSFRKVQRFITCKDPDGARVEFFYGLDVDAHVPFHSPRAISGFHTGTDGLGHILLLTKDSEETERFYRDVLGFKISDYVFSKTGGADKPARKLHFFHVNGRHHSLALGPGLKEKRLTHWMMQANDIEDVGRTYDLVRRSGVKLRLDIGGHLNDHMTSFYMTTPSGFSVEFGWGGRVVDDDEWVVQQYHTGDIWGHHPEDWDAQSQSRQTAGAPGR